MRLHGRGGTPAQGHESKLPTIHAARRTATVPQPAKHQLNSSNLPHLFRNRSSAASIPSDGSSPSLRRVEPFSTATGKERPSGLPRTTGSSQSNARLEAIAMSRPLPSLSSSRSPRVTAENRNNEVSGTDSSSTHRPTQESRSLEHGHKSSRGADRDRSVGGSQMKSPSAFRDGMQQESIFSTAEPEAVLSSESSTARMMTLSSTRSDELPPTLIPELRALAAASELNRSQALTAAGLTSSPSSLYSHSPGAWSSRDTTPTSMSSYSPGIVQPLKLRSSPRYTLGGSIFQKRAHSRTSEPDPPELPKLPVLAEAPEIISRGRRNHVPATPETSRDKEKKRKKTPPSPGPTPPPRKSSSNFNSPRSGGVSSDLVQRVMGTKGVPPSGNQLESPLKTKGKTSFGRVGESLQRQPEAQARHNRDQNPVADQQQQQQQQQQQHHHERSAYDSKAVPLEHGGGARAGAEAQPRDQHPDTIQDAIAQSVQTPFSGGGQRGHPPGYAGQAQMSREVLDAPPSYEKPATFSNHEQSVPRTTPSPRSAFAKLSRLGLFSRRTTPEPSRPPQEPNKLRRKGPAAGTGHEGYQKLSIRSRKTSLESASSHDKRSSTHSAPAPKGPFSRKDSADRRRESKSSRTDSEADQFVSQRLEPVVIVGGGGYRHRPGSDAPTVWPTFDQGTATGDAYRHQDPQQQMQDENPTFDASKSRLAEPYAPLPTSSPTSPSIAERRSFHRARLGDDVNVVTVPPPIVTENLVASSTVNSYDTSLSSLPRMDSSLPFVDNDMHIVDPKHLKKAARKGRSRKWNFFSRGNNINHPPKATDEQVRAVPEVPVSVAPYSKPRSVPYYALMDSDTENDLPESLGHYLSEAVDATPPTVSDNISTTRPNTTSKERGPSVVLLPSLPPLKTRFDDPKMPPSPKVALHRFDPAPPRPDTTQERPRRLHEVGRIPRVISRNDHRKIPAMESYSRPFSRGRVDTDQAAMLQKSIADSERPILGIQTDVLPSRPFDGYDSGKPASAPARARVEDSGQYQPQQEFLRFQSRHGSEVSVSTTSEPLLSMARPELQLDQKNHQAEEEVWNEYDEFIDHVMSPRSPRTAQSTTSSSGDPFRYMDRIPDPPPQSRPQTSQSVPDQFRIGNRLAPAPAGFLNPNDLVASPIADIRLRRSKIAPALHASLSPVSPFSVGDLVAEYTERNPSDPEAHETSPATRPTPFDDLPQRSYSEETAPIQSHHHSTFLLEIAERDHQGPAAQSDLRFAALMTSKWLSFGRVLFSPVHQEIKARPERHVLVIDGLRNEDWAFYCALTYPSTMIHELRETDLPLSDRRRTRQDSRPSPPNYRYVDQSSLAERFPFPPSFFAAIVLRFPPAMSDGVVKLMLSECKRVLMPGGYVEISILDLDMVNMGSYTRKALRELKVRMSDADPEVSLKPVSDNIQNILGRKGFENLNRCVVGVPVAGKVAGSADSNSSPSSNGSHPQALHQARANKHVSPMAELKRKQREEKTNFSLSDLISDHSPTSDEKITKMVAKVGRFWFTHCYEAAVLPHGDLTRSIWADKKVLHECKTQGTGFKMLIAYAQKPAENRRRTMSEPNVSTLATAGVGAMRR